MQNIMSQDHKIKSFVLNRVLGRTIFETEIISVSNRVRAHLYTLPLGTPPPPLPGKTTISITGIINLVYQHTRKVCIGCIYVNAFTSVVGEQWMTDSSFLWISNF